MRRAQPEDRLLLGKMVYDFVTAEDVGRAERSGRSLYGVLKDRYEERVRCYYREVYEDNGKYPQVHCSSLAHNPHGRADLVPVDPFGYALDAEHMEDGLAGVVENFPYVSVEDVKVDTRSKQVVAVVDLSTSLSKFLRSLNLPSASIERLEEHCSSYVMSATKVLDVSSCEIRSAGKPGLYTVVVSLDNDADSEALEEVASFLSHDDSAFQALFYDLTYDYVSAQEDSVRDRLENDVPEVFKKYGSCDISTDIVSDDLNYYDVAYSVHCEAKVTDPGDAARYFVDFVEHGGW